MFRLAIAGGNISGSALISLLRGDPNVKLVGIYERKQDSPGAILAKKWNIPVFENIKTFLNANPEMIINVTGDPDLANEIRAAIGNKVEIVEGVGVRFIWEIIEKQKRARIEAFKAIENYKTIHALASKLPFSEYVDDFFMLILDSSLELTNTPAGSIAVYENKEMRLIVSKGLSKKFIENNVWSVMPGGLTEAIINSKEIFSVNDTLKSDYTRNNSLLISENIKAFLAAPIIVKDTVAGILYADDFKPRQFSERQKASLNLLSSLLGIFMDRTALIRNFKTELETKTKALEELNVNLEKKVIERTEELEKTNREFKRANEIKGKFIASMSHELRTPLNSILGFSNVLLEKTFGELTENQERYARNIHSAGKHLLDLINNILDLAKIEAGKYEMVYETFHLEDAITEVINIMKPLAEKKSIEIIISIGEGIIALTADRVKLKQILYNLLSNAIKFTLEGGMVKITVAKEVSSGGRYSGAIQGLEFIKFAVQDTGVGIGPEDKERIFDEFVQINSSLSKKNAGTGLGLALTKKLVELHGGNITVESKLGEGSIFTFLIPITSPAKTVEPEAEEAVSLAFPWMKEEAPLILIVEDDMPTVELLTLHLTQAGYKVSHAFNGEEAIQKARDLNPFAITLDVMLPKRDGWEVLQDLKSDPKTAGIPVIIHSIVDNRDLAFALGATDYLIKPLDKEALLSKLEEIAIAKGKRVLPNTVLIIEAEEDVTNYFKEIFEPQGFIIYSAPDGKRGIELTTALMPDVILLDFNLPDMIGFDVIKNIKEMPSTKDIPIFILAEKDISVEDRMALLGKIERIVQKHAFDTKELIGHIKDLEILYPKRAGLIDELTGVFSHRYFHIRLAQEVERATRYKLPLNLILLDIDFFGKYLSDHGEYHGNMVLKKVAELLRKNIRGSDVLVRYGGDAFALILPNTVLSSGLSLSNRFNAIIKNYPFLHEETQPKGCITASIGLVFLDGQTPEEFILCAEKALALSVKKGGDRVEVYSKEQDEEAIQH
ncbi:MAG: response regulator [Nitrospirota bacterium]